MVVNRVDLIRSESQYMTAKRVGSRVQRLSLHLQRLDTGMHRHSFCVPARDGT